MISSHLFEAYLECPSKCWLRAQNEPATEMFMPSGGARRTRAYRKEWLERRLAIVAEADRVLSPTFEVNRKEATWRFALEMRVQANDLECAFRRWNGFALRDAEGASNLSLPFRILKQADQAT